MDVGHSLFRRFIRDAGEWADLVRRWNAGLLGGRDCLALECSLARATRDEIERFIAPLAIDPGFGAVRGRCAALGWDHLVISDGLDFYIRRLLDREGFAETRVIANHLEFGPAGTLEPGFPHWERGCGRCGTCKGAEVARRQAAGEVVWFVGDGVSDRCAAPLADRLFAKRDLLRHARAAGIPVTPFETLADVLAELPLPGAPPSPRGAARGGESALNGPSREG